MATQVQFRRGTTTQNNAFTGAIGELTYDTEAKTLRLHDGSTAGGGAVVVTLAGSQTLTNKTLSTNSVWQGTSVGLAYGGTNASLTATSGGVIYSTASALAISAAGTSGQVLTSAGASAPTWTSQSSLSVGTATTATTATNISGGSAGYIMYQVDTNQTGFIAPGANGYILRSTGASTAPTWVTSALTIGSTALQVGDTSTSFDGLDILTATGTSHWKIPAGTTAQRPATPAVGMIRYNSSQSAYEGYASGAWASLGGVKSVDGYTYIIAETSPTASNGDLDFYAENGAGNAATQVGQWNRTNLKDYTGTLVGTQTTQNVFNATATTVNAFGAATSLTLGATSGTATLRNAVVAITNAATIGSTLAVVGNTTLTGDLAVNGGDITTTATTFNLLNTTATTLNIGGGASTVSIGAGSGTTTVNNSLTVTGDLTVNGTTTTINSTTLTVDDKEIVLASGAATSAAADGSGISVDGANATITYTHTGTKWAFNKNVDITGTLTASSNGSIGGTLGVTGAATLSSTLAVTGATTLTGALAANGGITVDSTNFTVDGTTGAVSTASTLSVGTNATVGGTLGVTGNTTLTGDIAVNGGDITTSATTFNLLNTTATTLNIGGAATTLALGASTGTLTVNNAKTVFNSTDSVQLPVGTTAQRNGTPVTGMIRYNSSLSTFEGYAASSWGSLGGVKSVDGYTYILAETSAGASNGDLDFYAEASNGTSATQVGQWNRTNLKDYTGTLVGTQTTQNVFNTTATTVNAFGAATSISLGAATGTLTLNNATTAISGAATVGSTLSVTGVTTLTAKATARASIDHNSGSTNIANQTVVQASVSSTSQTAVDTFAVATYRSAKYVVQVTQGTNYQVSEIMVIHNGTTTTMTEYGMMNTNGSLGTFTTDISAGNVRLLVTMGSATAATINITRTTIVV